jgi:hypothetical protein
MALLPMLWVTVDAPSVPGSDNVGDVDAFDVATVVADADGVAAVGVDCSPPSVLVLRDVLGLSCAPWVLAVAPPRSSTVRDVVRGVSVDVAEAAWVILCGPVLTAAFAASGCSCAEFDEGAADADPVGLESAGAVESGAAAATP